MTEHRLRFKENELETIKKAIWIRLFTLVYKYDSSDEEIQLYKILKKLSRKQRGRTQKQSEVTRNEIKELIMNTSYLVPVPERNKIMNN